MDFQKYIKKIRTILSYHLFNGLIFLILALLMFGILYHNVKPETYDMELFSISDKTIRSPKTIEDEEKTAEEREKTADEVEDVYVFKRERSQNRVLLLTSIFDFVQEVKQDDGPEAEKLTSLKAKLTADVTEDVTETIADETFVDLLQVEEKELLKAKEAVIHQVETIMSGKIREDQVEKAHQTVVERIRVVGLPESLEQATIELAKYAIIPNDLYDRTLTEERKKQAMEEVEPVKILQGQVIVQEGHLIDSEIYRQLELLGLLKSAPTMKPFIGLAIFVFLAVGTIYALYYRLKLPDEKRQNYLLLIAIIFTISLIMMKMISLMEEVDQHDIAYLFPAALMAMLLKVLINERVALMMTAILAACGGIIFHDDITGTIEIEIALYILFSGLAGIVFLSERSERNNILRAGFLVACVNVLFIFFMLFLSNVQITKLEYIYYVVYGLVSGLMSAVLTLGLLPFLEAGFGILSTMRMIELSNPNHPLLKRILTDAPGTYHHSVMVANLAESACEAIGANGLLARVGSYYHDLGKTKRPHFFIENQMNFENPHDRLPPEKSKDIIIAHARDGAEMLRKFKMPKEIVDIAEQHHGTSLLKYFYYKAKELDKETKESDYRYPGPKPQTLEAAVVSLADSVEAAVRSLKQPTPEKIKSLVHQIVEDRLLDGQFNESDLTLKQLEVIKETFQETLSGIFHSRIEYPDNREQKVNRDGTGN